MAQDHDVELFHEIEEDVRLESLKRLWQRYRFPILAAVIGAVVSAAAIFGWRWVVKNRSETAVLSYLNAGVDSQKSLDQKGLAFLENEIKTQKGGVLVLSQFRLAAEKSALGELEKATALYGEIVNNTSVPFDLRAFAAVRSAYILVDTKTPQELKALLSDYDRPDLKWRFFVREVAALSAYRLGQYDVARKELEANMAEPDLPVAMRQRHQLFLDVLAPLSLGPVRGET